MAAIPAFGGLWSIGLAVLVAAVLVANPLNLRAQLPFMQDDRLQVIVGYAFLVLVGGGLLVANGATLRPSR
jgi:hypothetical protein